MSSWMRIALGVTILALVLLQLVAPQRGTPSNVWLRWLPPIAFVLVAIGIIAPDAAIAPATRYVVFGLALVYSWFRWVAPRRST